MTLQFTLPIIPTAQRRARHARSGRTYKCAEQTADERTLEAALIPHRPENPMRGPVRLVFTACMPMPASASKKRRASMREGNIGHVVRPDVDNLCKQLLDAMTRLRFWEDDRQVVELVARKQYDDAPRWVVEVSESG